MSYVPPNQYPVFQGSPDDTTTATGGGISEEELQAALANYVPRNGNSTITGNINFDGNLTAEGSTYSSLLSTNYNSNIVQIGSVPIHITGASSTDFTDQDLINALEGGTGETGNYLPLTGGVIQPVEDGNILIVNNMVGNPILEMSAYSATFTDGSSTYFNLNNYAGNNMFSVNTRAPGITTPITLFNINDSNGNQAFSIEEVILGPTAPIVDITVNSVLSTQALIIRNGLFPGISGNAPPLSITNSTGETTYFLYIQDEADENFTLTMNHTNMNILNTDGNFIMNVVIGDTPSFSIGGVKINLTGENGTITDSDLLALSGITNGVFASQPLTTNNLVVATGVDTITTTDQAAGITNVNCSLPMTLQSDFTIGNMQIKKDGTTGSMTCTQLYNTVVQPTFVNFSTTVILNTAPISLHLGYVPANASFFPVTFTYYVTSGTMGFAGNESEYVGFHLGITAFDNSLGYWIPYAGNASQGQALNVGNVASEQYRGEPGANYYGGLVSACTGPNDLYLTLSSAQSAVGTIILTICGFMTYS